MDKLGKLCWHQWSALKLVKTAKFESDFLKTNEDIVPQSRSILQMFIWWGAQTWPPPPHYPHTFKLGKFINFKALFPVVPTGFP